MVQSTRPTQLDALEPRWLLSVTDASGDLGDFFPGAAAAPACRVDVPAAGEVTLNIAAAARTPAAYRIISPAAGRLTLLARAVDPAVDPALWVYDAAGGLLARNDNVSRGSSDSLVRLRIAAGQTLTIFAQTASAGRYTLTATSEAADDAGNTLDSARSLVLDGQGDARWAGRIDYAGDVDVLAVTARAAGTMQITLANVAGLSAAGGSLSVLDAAGQRVNALAAAGNVGGDVTEQLGLGVSAGSVYYIQAGPAAQEGQQYRIVISTEPSSPPAPPAPQGGDDPAPGDGDGGSADPAATELTAEAMIINGQGQLVIAGSDGNDVITLRQADDVITLEVGAYVQVFSGSFAQITIDTFAGNDTITLAHSLSVPVWVRAGAGSDTLYAAGTGADVLDGGAGDDLIISVGGAADRLAGSTGADSFWMDGADAAADVSAPERAGAMLHRILEFQQPVTHTLTSPRYVSLEIAGQNLPDPAIGSPAVGYVSFAGHPLFSGDIGYSDIEQGAVGDCYLLASLAGYAQARGQVIRQMIAPLGDGTFAVRFFRDGRESYIRVDADLPVMYGTTLAFAGLGAEGQMWAPLVEKAYAVFRYGENSYASLSGGWMADVYRHVADDNAANWSISIRTDAEIFSSLQTSLAAGRVVTAGTSFFSVGPIIAGHAYTVMSAEDIGGQMFVTVYNPWGIDGRAFDANPEDGLLRLTITQFATAFTLATMDAA